MSLIFDKSNSVVNVFDKQSLSTPDKPFLWNKADENYISYSWKEIRNKVEKFSNALINIGILEGDRVVIISENRPEWLIADLAIMTIGAITVPAYITSTKEDYEYILKHSGARCAIVSNHALAQKLIPASLNSPKCENIIKINSESYKYNDPISILQWDTLLDENKNINLDEYVKRHKRNDTACIIYTSGTGGNPKGVMLSHGAMLTNCSGAKHLLNEIQSDLKEIRFLSWLPLSHSYEHTLQFYIIGVAAQIYYAEGIDKLLVNMSESKPHFMTAVPRFYDSLHTRISQGLKKQSKISQFLFNETLRLGKKTYFNEPLNFFEKKFNGVLDKIVRKKVKKRFGGSLKALISGGAALNFEVGLYLSALGLPLLQGYGQTETGPVVTANPPNKIKLDTVGPIFKGTQIKIADDGEILVTGENVMNGYWNDPEATSSTLVNGWIHTGDIGVIDSEGYLKITDRKKDIIVNAGGDNISPSRIEEKINIEPEFVQSMMYGDFKNYLVAILVPDKEFAKQWAEKNKKEFDIKKLNFDPEFTKTIKEATDRINKNLSQTEQIRKFLLIDEEFTIENDMMTPTLKVRRFMVKKKYLKKLEELY
tara:strand:+ start:543 stop:2327 length:1785 start_codon:yes stop_codon:yes gene_type:complete